MRSRKNALVYKKNVFAVLTTILVSVTLLPTSCTNDGETKHLYTIGLITNNRNGLRNIEGFQDKMTELGYIVGSNVKYMFEGIPVKGSALDAVLDRMIEAKVDLIFTAGTPTGVAAYRKTSGTNITIIFGVIADPVAAGVINDLTTPGANMTGVKLSDNQARRLQFLLQISPHIKRVLIPYNPEDAASSSAVAQLKEVASDLGVEIVALWAHNEQEVFEMLNNLPVDLDAIFLVPGTTVNIHLQRVLSVARARKMPVSGPSLAQVEEGALITYGFSHFEVGRQAARIADQVLKGTDPGKLPVETAEFFMAVNLKSAEEIGLRVPDSILQQAAIIIRSD